MTEPPAINRRLANRGLPARLLSSDYVVLLLSVVYFLALAPFTPGFASSRNLADILSNLLPLLVVATGQTCVLISGGIDLSVTSTIALSSITGAWLMNPQTGALAGHPLAVPAAIAAMLLVGWGVGALNGAAVTRLRMPPFIVTLTSMMFFSGFAIWLTQSRKIGGLPPEFTRIGREVGLVVLPASALLAFLAHTALTRTLFGRWLYAVGHNPTAALISGVPVRQVTAAAYRISGVCAAAASVIYTARLETGDPVLGQRILLDVIGATVIGGTSLFGGKGKVLGTVFGVMFFALLDNSLNLLGLSHFTIMMTKGGIILLAAFLDTLRHR